MATAIETSPGFYEISPLSISTEEEYVDFRMLITLGSNGMVNTDYNGAFNTTKFNFKVGCGGEATKDSLIDSPDNDYSGIILNSKHSIDDPTYKAFYVYK